MLTLEDSIDLVTSYEHFEYNAYNKIIEGRKIYFKIHIENKDDTDPYESSIGIDVYGITSNTHYNIWPWGDDNPYKTFNEYRFFYLNCEFSDFSDYD